MTRPVRLPTQRSSFAGHEARIYELERKLRARQEQLRPENLGERAPFSHAGAITVTTSGEEPEWDVEFGGQVTGAVVRLKTAGSSSTVVTFYLNGASMGTVTLASSETRKVAYLGDYHANPTDSIGARITTAGTGAKGLSAFVRMKG